MKCPRDAPFELEATPLDEAVRLGQWRNVDWKPGELSRCFVTDALLWSTDTRDAHSSIGNVGHQLLLILSCARTSNDLFVLCADGRVGYVDAYFIATI